MTNCYECDTPLTTICPQCNALSAAPSSVFPVCGDITCDGNPCSAAPSPAPDEVEAVARAIEPHMPAQVKYWQEGGMMRAKLIGQYDPEYVSPLPAARAAISAMRPTLSEEDRARVSVALLDAQSLLLDRFADWESDSSPVFREPGMELVYGAVRDAVVLLDKLTEKG